MPNHKSLPLLLGIILGLNSQAHGQAMIGGNAFGGNVGGFGGNFGGPGGNFGGFAVNGGGFGGVNNFNGFGGNAGFGGFGNRINGFGNNGFGINGGFGNGFNGMGFGGPGVGFAGPGGGGFNPGLSNGMPPGFVNPAVSGMATRPLTSNNMGGLVGAIETHVTRPSSVSAPPLRRRRR